LSWGQQVSSVIGAGVLFGILGTLIGAFVFVGITELIPHELASLPGKTASISVLWLWLGAALLGGVPAVATGMAASILRRRIRPLLTFACVTAIVGMLATAIFMMIVAGMPSNPMGLVPASVTGGIAAFSCALLLFHNRR
jgi:hypothetical protein